MKKLITTLAIILFGTMNAFASNDANINEVKSTFVKYVSEANAYSSSLPSYYVNNAKIIRVVNKKQGGRQSVIIPYERYVKELNSHSVLARTVGYKNSYINQTVTKVGNDYKLSATRVPRNDKVGLPCYFVFTKTAKGWKIKEESMTTNVQTFLSAK